jgi:starch phosphorylase
MLNPKQALRRYPSKSNIVREELLCKSKKDIETETPKTKQKVDSLKHIKNKELLWNLMGSYIDKDIRTIQRRISDNIEYTLARDRSNIDNLGGYQATAYSVRERLIEFWNDTNFRFTEENPKQVYYLSIEYLLGRSLQNALINLDIEKNYKEALKELGFRLENFYEQETDAGLGNGGLGRLAACFLDSLATQNYCSWGYGLRYSYGMFLQDIFEGYQVEIPDTWLKYGNPWEITRFDVKYLVRFYGTAKDKFWEGGETVLAMAHDVPIPGFRTTNTLNLRLWSSQPSSDFDLASFNEGNYYKVIEKRQEAETLSSVLYPNDNTPEGKELRLKQQYFFISASLQDIIKRFRGRKNEWNDLPNKVSIQLNDTHPTLAIPELMRILMDIESLPWEKAEELTRKVFSYTNHTILPEALEKWSIPLLERVLPRHIKIIYEINFRFLNEASKKFNNNQEILRRLSVIEESNPKMVRMANLAIIMSHHVNGVAEIHSKILKESIFKEFAEFFPEKFLNITNGITPRRWLHNCNPLLSNLIEKTLGDDSFLLNLDKLSELKKFIDDENLQKRWAEIKLENKKKLATYLREKCNIEVNPNALFDIQVKRIHEYKRQLLNILRVIYLYKQLKLKAETTVLDDNIIPKVIIFGGKAAPGYHKAKMIIKLINSVAEKVNRDKQINELLKVVFIPNYSVSLAEIIIPASDISEHISTAGTEASGTSNMKFALNGGLIIGTLDGANIEIRDSIGKENMFIFGLTADEVDKARFENQQKQQVDDPRLQEVIETIKSGEFGDPNIFSSLLDSLYPPHDYYLVGNDFTSYLEIHQEIDKVYQNPKQWTTMCINSTAGMGKFSSDRSIKEYAEKIWGIKPLLVPNVVQN